MNDDLKISKREYLSNHWLSFGDQNQNSILLEKKTTPMEDDFQILKVEYLTNHWLVLRQISKLS